MINLEELTTFFYSRIGNDKAEFIGEIPEFTGMIGNRYPCYAITYGPESEFDYNRLGSYTSKILVKILVYTQETKNRIKNINDVINAIINRVHEVSITNLACIQAIFLYEINRGLDSEDIDSFNPLVEGSYGLNRTVSSITFEVTTVRS